MKPLIKYDSNNSGGSWWLKDKDWYALEAAGWTVEWGVPGEGLFGDEEDPDHPGKARWLGGLARAASKRVETFAEGILNFEEVTGQSASDEGCNCCGPPHSFQFYPTGHDNDNDYGSREYASGEDVCGVLYGADAPTTLREALERN